jgi:hypothetical protein
MGRLLVELSGEHPGLAAAEVAGALRALGDSPGALHREGRLLLSRPPWMRASWPRGWH